MLSSQMCIYHVIDSLSSPTLLEECKGENRVENQVEQNQTNRICPRSGLYLFQVLTTCLDMIVKSRRYFSNHPQQCNFDISKNKTHLDHSISVPKIILKVSIYCSLPVTQLPFSDTNPTISALSIAVSLLNLTFLKNFKYISNFQTFFMPSIFLF